ncbi:LOW QUALITY PROTEIN: hypothetical protein V2J09_023341 [Rumex salicifolius]
MDNKFALHRSFICSSYPIPSLQILHSSRSTKFLTEFKKPNSTRDGKKISAVSIAIRHQNPMFELGNILHSRGFSISIIHTKFQAPNPAKYPQFSFHFFEDGLLDTGTSFDELVHIINKLNRMNVDPFTDCLSLIIDAPDHEPVACLITDCLWHFTSSVAHHFNIPRLVLRTGNLTTVTMYFALARLPLKDPDPEELVPDCYPVRFKELYRMESADQSPSLELATNALKEIKSSKGLIFNSIQEIEEQSHAFIQKELSVSIFPIGPFHKWLPAQEQDSVSWLDSQAPNSVLFASFGSLASVDRDGFLDMAWGLANSNVPFLWVVRSDLVHSSDGLSPLPDEFLQKVSGRGLIVRWASQKAVLAHPAVGGFWTHCGWNSTLESLCEGMPMICTPSFGDQMMNTRYVTDVWRVGLRLDKGAKTEDVERAITTLMAEAEGAEMRKRAACLKNKATNCLLPGGSSCKYMEDLVNLINKVEIMQQKMGRKLVIFPLPFVGHQNPTFEIANILHSKGFSITVIHTNFHSPDPAKYPDFNFHFIEDGLSGDEVPFEDVIALANTLNKNCVESFKACLAQILNDHREPVSCLITDAMWHFTQTVADSLQVPRIAIRTGNLSSFTLFLARLELKDKQPDDLLPELPPLRVKDIPRLGNLDQSPLEDLLSNMIKQAKASKGLIFNAIEEIEDRSMAIIQHEFQIPVFPIGPFHKYISSPPTNLPTHHQNSISWLDSQAPNSVLYVSFGSLAAIDEAGFRDMAWGLANSKQPFFWVIRSDLVQSSNGSSQLPDGFMEIVSGRGHIVSWAPQKEVLAHPAVGGFWTHSGWNSTLESICEGVPMLCSPCFGDQMVNARYVSEVWKIGLQLEKGAKTDEIEKAITTLMAEKEGEDIRERALCLMNKANSCLQPDGSSYKHMEGLLFEALLIAYLSS